MTSSTFEIRTNVREQLRGIYNHELPRPAFRWAGGILLAFFSLIFLAAFVLALLLGEPTVILRFGGFFIWPIPFLIALHIRRPSQVTFDQTGLRVTFSRNEIAQSWSDIVSWTERAGLLTLEFDKRRLVILPTRDLAGTEGLQAFRRLLPTEKANVVEIAS
jgi:hypothetical protein